MIFNLLLAIATWLALAAFVCLLIHLEENR